MIKVDPLTNFDGSLGALKTVVETLIKLHGDDTEITVETRTGDNVEFYLREEGDL